MNNLSDTPTHTCLRSATETARKRKRNILIAIPSFWFVVGILLIVYVRHLAGPDMFTALTIPQFHQLIGVLALAGLITYLLFGYWWLRLDHVERGLQYSVIQTFLGLAFMWSYFRDTRTSGENWRTFWGSIVLRVSCVLACYAGAYVAGMALIE